MLEPEEVVRDTPGYGLPAGKPFKPAPPTWSPEVAEKAAKDAGILYSALSRPALPGITLIAAAIAMRAFDTKEWSWARWSEFVMLMLYLLPSIRLAVIKMWPGVWRRLRDAQSYEQLAKAQARNRRNYILLTAVGIAAAVAAVAAVDQLPTVVQLLHWVEKALTGS